jgi:hypothetical protein
MERIVLLGALLAPFNYLVGVPLGDTTIHPLEPWAALLLAATLIFEPRILLAAADIPTMLLWTMFAFVLTSTVFATPDEYRARGFFDVLLLGMNLAAFMLTYGRLRSGRTNWAAFAGVLFASSLAASAFLTLRALSITGGGVFAGADSFVLGLGTVAGTYTAAFTAASMAGMTFGRTRRLRLAMLVGVAVHGVAASFALARGPWIALGVAFVGCLLLGMSSRPRLLAPAIVLGRGFLAALVLAVVTTATAMANSVVGGLLGQRLVGITNVTTGTGLSRLTLFRALFADALDSPLFGHGASAYRRISELLAYQGSVSENFLLEMFHAGGALAALPLAIAAALVLLRLVRSLRVPDQGGAPLIYLAGLVTLMLGALTNPAAWNTMFWILLAMGAALPFGLEARPSPVPSAAEVRA